MNLDIAVGEVPWERRLLEAVAADPTVRLDRRYVDLAAVPDAGGLLIVCPSVRGFTEVHLQRLARQRTVVIIQDSIRPPWLQTTGLPLHDINNLSFGEFVASCALIEPTPPLHVMEHRDRGRITAFAGVAGGVGVTTLTWLAAEQRSDCVIVDGNLRQPGLALLAGNGRPSKSMSAAVRALQREDHCDLLEQVVHRARGRAVIAPPVDGSEPCSGEDLLRLVIAAADRFPQVFVDVGQFSVADQEGLLTQIDALVLVTLATPLGLVRLCAQQASWSHASHEVSVIVNRVRSSVAGSRHVATAMQNFVSSELGMAPLLIPDLPADCDRGWLTGEWGSMARQLATMQLRQTA